jgi:hypothetical protein
MSSILLDKAGSGCRLTGGSETGRSSGTFHFEAQRHQKVDADPWYGRDRVPSRERSECGKEILYDHPYAFVSQSRSNGESHSVGSDF